LVNRKEIKGVDSKDKNLRYSLLAGIEMTLIMPPNLFALGRIYSKSLEKLMAFICLPELYPAQSEPSTCSRFIISCPGP
jgi:hypothetical protein